MFVNLKILCSMLFLSSFSKYFSRQQCRKLLSKISSKQRNIVWYLNKTLKPQLYDLRQYHDQVMRDYAHIRNFTWRRVVVKRLESWTTYLLHLSKDFTLIDRPLYSIEGWWAPLLLLHYLEEFINSKTVGSCYFGSVHRLKKCVTWNCVQKENPDLFVMS